MCIIRLRFASVVTSHHVASKESVRTWSTPVIVLSPRSLMKTRLLRSQSGSEVISEMENGLLAESELDEVKRLGQRDGSFIHISSG